MRSLLTLLGLLAGAVSLLACDVVGRRVVFTRPYVAPARRAVVRHNSYEDEVYVSNVFAVAVYVPTFVTGYAPPAPQTFASAVPPAPRKVAAPAPAGDAALRDEIARLRERLRALEGGGPAPAQAQAQSAEHPAVAILYAKCAACHEAAAPKGGVTLFSGKSLAPLTDALVRRSMRKLKRGEMPPPENDRGITPLGEEEMATVVDFLVEGR